MAFSAASEVIDFVAADVDVLGVDVQSHDLQKM